MTPYYPINNKDNAEMYDKYRKESKSLTKFVFGGRLAEYKYMDMHIVIESAMNTGVLNEIISYRWSRIYRV